MSQDWTIGRIGIRLTWRQRLRRRLTGSPWKRSEVIPLSSQMDSNVPGWEAPLTMQNRRVTRAGVIEISYDGGETWKRYGPPSTP